MYREPAHVVGTSAVPLGHILPGEVTGWSSLLDKLPPVAAAEPWLALGRKAVPREVTAPCLNATECWAGMELSQSPGRPEVQSRMQGERVRK